MSNKYNIHGISVSLQQLSQKLMIEVAMIGKLTHEDYEAFVPVIDRALKNVKDQEVDLLIDMEQFRGWKWLAAWDDFKFGIKHRNAFDKMAIVGDKKWEEVSTNMMNHLMSGKVKYFTNRDKALKWLTK